MSEINLKSIFDKISDTINSEYNLTGIGSHKGIKGSKREKIVRHFLRDNLPQQYSLGDGEIFNSEGNISNQIDIIIHNSHMPVFRYSKYLLFYPIESVFGVCEVKSKLDKKRLEEAVLNIQSVKKMVLEKPGMLQGQFNERVYGTVFAFDSISVNHVKRNLTKIYDELEIPSEEKIDLICVLGKFIALGNPTNQGWQPQDELVIEDPLFLDTQRNSLMLFVPTMINGFNKPLSQNFNFHKYIKMEFADL